jgi:competence protein ComEC
MSNRSVVTALVFLAILIVGFWLGILLRLKRLGDMQAAVGPLLIAQFIDVGDGDAALIHSPDGISILIDSGPDQTGAHGIVQALRIQGAPQAIILASTRAGSIGGLPYVLNNVPIHCPVVLPCSPPQFLADGGLAAQVDMETAERKHLDVLSLDQFESSPLMAGLANSTSRIILIPVSESLQSRVRVRAGGQSDALAVRVEYGASGLLYAAALDPVEEDKLIANRVNLPCDVLAATDSAAPGTLSSEFLALTGPKIVVVSTSADAPPDEQVLARLAAADAVVDRTDLLGTVALGLSDQPAVPPTYFAPTAVIPVGPSTH